MMNKRSMLRLIALFGLLSELSLAGFAAAGEQPITFEPPKRPTQGPGGIAVRSSLETIFAEEAPEPDANPIVSLSAARRERESAQLVIISGDKPLSVTGVGIDRLTIANGTAGIAPENVKAELVGYVAVERSTWRGWKRTGLWPDVLLPIRPFKVPAGYCRLIWVTVRVPADTPAGDYRGRITLEFADDMALSVRLKLHVYRFALPGSPSLKTSHWTDLKTAYEGGLANEVMARKLYDLFGAYRTSTDVYAGAQYFLEPDGVLTVQFEQTKRNINYAATVAGFNTLNIGNGCWGASGLNNPSILDRRTGRPISEEQRKQALAAHDPLKLYLNEMCNWLESHGWLERAYLQLWDEAARDTWEWGMKQAYPSVRRKEPRLRLLSVVGVHPELQGLLDVWVPHLHFFDPTTYQQAREGVRLSGKKNFPAKVTASSTGGWGNGSFYDYRPPDAYDGCYYTKWVPQTAPTPKKPQQLVFTFDQSQQIDGIRILPCGPATSDLKRTVEVSRDGQEFTPVKLVKRN